MALFRKIIEQNQEEIFIPHLEGYTNYLLENKYNPGTIYHALNYIQHFGKYLFYNRRIKEFSKVSLAVIEDFLKYYTYRFPDRPLRLKKYLIVLKGYIKQFLYYLEVKGIKQFRYLHRNKNKIPYYMRNIVKEYFEFCRQQRGLKEGTIYLYRTWILRFINFIKNKKIKDIRILKITDIDEFMSKYAYQLGRVSIYSMHSALRSFLRYLYMYDYTDNDMSEYIISSKTYAPRLIPKHISWKQIKNILKNIDTSTNNGKVLYAILILFINYGLRPIEISKLKLSDIDWSKKEIFFRERKSGKDLVLPLRKDVEYAILQYLQIRSDVSCPEIFVTPNASHRSLTPSYISDMVVQYLQKTGINLPIKGPYIFRHSLAKRLIEKGASIVDISSILGHKSISSTMKYLRISTEELREVSDNYANLL